MFPLVGGFRLLLRDSLFDSNEIHLFNLIMETRLRTSIIILSAVFIILASFGCATITRGTKDTLVVESTPPNADIEISNGLRGKTPASFQMPRKESIIVKITKEGYHPVEVNVTSQTKSAGSAALAGNVLLGGVVGLGVDGFSGATKDLVPNPIQVTLEKIEVEVEKSSTEDRLGNLQKLHESGDISEEEYQEARKKIIGDV
jgi:hypothetical protein